MPNVEFEDAIMETLKENASRFGRSSVDKDEVIRNHAKLLNAWARYMIAEAMLQQAEAMRDGG